MYLKLHRIDPSHKSSIISSRYVKQIHCFSLDEVRHRSPKENRRSVVWLNEGDHTLVFTVDTQLFPHYFSGSTFQRRLAPLVVDYYSCWQKVRYVNRNVVTKIIIGAERWISTSWNTQFLWFFQVILVAVQSYCLTYLFTYVWRIHNALFIKFFYCSIPISSVILSPLVATGDIDNTSLNASIKTARLLDIFRGQITQFFVLSFYRKWWWRILRLRVSLLILLARSSRLW